MTSVLILTGPGGAGKSTIGQLLEEKYGFAYLDADREDTEFFPEGGQWLPENRELLAKAHEKILQKTKEIALQGKNVAVDYIIFGQYLRFIDLFKQEFGPNLYVKVLMPSRDALIKRDTERKCWTTGTERIDAVTKEFMEIQDAIGRENFIDSTKESPVETATRLNKELSAS